MDKEYKEIRQITKEIVVKFIEMGKITPSSFPQLFPVIYNVVEQTLSPANKNEASKAQASESELETKAGK